MTKVILSDKLVVELGRMLGEDYTRFGHHIFNIGNAEGLFTEAFVDMTKAEIVDDNAELYQAEDSDVIGFFAGVKPTNEARQVGFVPADIQSRLFALPMMDMEESKELLTDIHTWLTPLLLAQEKPDEKETA